MAYVARLYSGKITFFSTANERTSELPDPTLGWGVLAGGGIEQYVIPGPHETLLVPPQVVPLAEKLQECLDRATLPQSQA